jgi:hypothetical protein
MTTVFRVEKNREFVVMHNKFLREKEMSLKAKGLLALCLALPDDWNYSLNGLCAICKESQTSIRSALKELETFKSFPLIAKYKGEIAGYVNVLLLGEKMDRLKK